MIREATDYLLRRAPENFPNWTLERLEEYVAFHVAQQTLFLVTNPHGLLIGWQQSTNAQEKWQWQKSDPSGQYWWWDQFMADSPASALAVAHAFIIRHPISNRLPSAGMRNGRLRQYSPGHSINMWLKAFKKYGI